jgi:hypothetical protein
MLILQIDYQNTASPASVGLDGRDKRDLAVFFSSLRIEFSGVKPQWLLETQARPDTVVRTPAEEDLGVPIGWKIERFSPVS